MRDRPRSSTVFALRLATLAMLAIVPRSAAAQVHWDMGGEVGVMQRLTTRGDPGAPAPRPGPVGELYAHVALLPMIRLGPYFTHDISPLSGAPSRQISAAGVRIKLSPPLLKGAWQTWAFSGVGYARTYEPSHRLVATDAFVPGAGGGLLDLRLGLGLGYRLSRPWVLFVELGGRFGIALTGSMYERGACGCGEPYVGEDSFALSLSVGLSLNQ
jgi:hypothetical protein